MQNILRWEVQVHSVFLNHKKVQLTVQLMHKLHTMQIQEIISLKTKQSANQNQNELTLSHNKLIYSSISITKSCPYKDCRNNFSYMYTRPAKL